MKINIVGIPSFAGALYSGTEMAPGLLRSAGLLEKLKEAGVEAVDLGDIQMPQVLPRHNVPPVRNWPSPRTIWEQIVVENWLQQNEKSLIIGGDCSIIVGTTSKLYEVYGDKLHILVVDAHVDAVPVKPERCLGAAASGLWFLFEESPLWPKRAIKKNNVTVLGNQTNTEQEYGFSTISLGELREKGIRPSLERLLKELPHDAKLFVHFDVDALVKDVMPAAYSPSEQGLNESECQEMLTSICRDDRFIGLEVTEFSGLKDLEGHAVSTLVNILTNSIAGM